jgi:hypothetical protein
LSHSSYFCRMDMVAISRSGPVKSGLVSSGFLRSGVP